MQGLLPNFQVAAVAFVATSFEVVDTGVVVEAGIVVAVVVEHYLVAKEMDHLGFLLSFGYHQTYFLRIWTSGSSDYRPLRYSLDLAYFVVDYQLQVHDWRVQCSFCFDFPYFLAYCFPYFLAFEIPCCLVYYFLLLLVDCYLHFLAFDLPM